MKLNAYLSFQGTDRFGSIESQYVELRAWLTAKIGWFDQLHLSKGQAPMDYNEYTKFRNETAAKREVYERLRQLQETNKNAVGIDPAAWNEIDTNWQKVESQLRHWQWILDTALPGELGQVGEWLNQGEALVFADDVPTQLNEEAAAVLNQKIEDHKAFFGDLNSVQRQFANACKDGALVSQVPKVQLESMARRLKDIGPMSDIRAVRLKYLEHKVSCNNFF